VEEKSVRINADKAKLTSAPEFTKEMDNEAAMAKTDYLSKSFEYFDQTPWWQGGTASASTSELPTVRKAKDLLNKKVKNVSDEDIGKIEDLMVNLPAGRIAFAILQPDSSLALGNNYYALPPDALTFNKDGKSLTSDLTKEKLATAPHVAKGEWMKLSDPSFASQVYQFYGKQAWFNTTGSGLKPTGRADEAK
jgi:sporulation protein YlmC with PRC-barrel domain